LREDLALVTSSHIDVVRLGNAAHTVKLALIALWATGLALVVLDVGLNAAALLRQPKLAAKFFVVIALTANGIALHALAFPTLLGHRAQLPANVAMTVVLGAISTSSWLYASFIGVSRSIEPTMSFGAYMALYATLLCGAIIVAIVFVRPRVERMLARSRVYS
jgi:hypothetical protein